MENLKDDIKQIFPTEWFSEKFRGFECGDGWLDIIYNLFLKIKNLQNIDAFQVVQIKEKFGCLRIYAKTTDERIKSLIEKTEDSSYSICEICGKNGRLINDNETGKSLIVKCQDHYNNYE